MMVMKIIIITKFPICKRSEEFAKTFDLTWKEIDIKMEQ